MAYIWQEDIFGRLGGGTYTFGGVAVEWRGGGAGWGLLSEF